MAALVVDGVQTLGRERAVRLFKVRIVRLAQLENLSVAQFGHGCGSR